MSLAEEIRRTRKKALLSQEDFAKELHVTVGTINRWGNGKTRPNITAMKAIKTFCKDKEFSYESIENKWIEETCNGK